MRMKRMGHPMFYRSGIRRVRQLCFEVYNLGFNFFAQQIRSLYDVEKQLMFILKILVTPERRKKIIKMLRN